MQQAPCTIDQPRIAVHQQGLLWRAARLGGLQHRQRSCQLVGIPEVVLIRQSHIGGRGCRQELPKTGATATPLALTTAASPTSGHTTRRCADSPARAPGGFIVRLWGPSRRVRSRVAGSSQGQPVEALKPLKVTIETHQPPAIGDRKGRQVDIGAETARQLTAAQQLVKHVPAMGLC